MGRRLLLIALHSLIVDPFWRAFSLTLGCLGVLLVHVLLRPFRTTTAQVWRCSTLSLKN